MTLRRVLFLSALALVLVLVVAGSIGAVMFAAQGGMAPYRVPEGGTMALPADAATLARGEYLARIGNCVGCHTARNGEPFAGGRGFRTDIGTVFSTNLTPDREHGIGAWSPEAFLHAMRHGVSRRGALYPVFPYAHFVQVSEADLLAILAWLRTLPPSASEPPPNRLEPPADDRRALIGWRMLHYRPAEAQPLDPADRGRYLVDGLGHCAMCHSRRGDHGSLVAGGHMAGGTIPGIGWYAPPLDRDQLARFSETELADYLRFGDSPHGAAYGPMAEVIQRSLSGLTPDDALAMARHLKHIEPAPLREPTQAAPAVAAGGGAGARIYREACADCHGDNGEGVAGRYPPLRGSVSATAPDPVNAVRLVLYGGSPITSAANPRPHSMPPFVQQLDAGEVAAVVNHVRGAFGGRDSRLDASDVQAMSGIVLD